MYPKMDSALLERIKRLDAASLSDALDRLGIPGGCYGIKPVTGGQVMVGQAFTVKYIPCGVVKRNVGDFLEDVEPGQVVVIDNAGRDYCTSWGDIMTIFAVQKGIAGTVIDGACRDVRDIRAMNYPMYSKGIFMVTGKDRVELDSVNQPVTIAGIQVRPGDVIYGDDSGVLVIPCDKAQEVTEIAEEIEEIEGRIKDEIRAGSSLAEARKKWGYHNLQTRRS